MTTYAEGLEPEDFEAVIRHRVAQLPKHLANDVWAQKAFEDTLRECIAEGLSIDSSVAAALKQAEIHYIPDSDNAV
ncbi:hypothetical protein C5E44_30560 [Nocardia nova]|uniref:hypothetical protein n=1 Tax=Nocardia nova TaxID=37330 RepID=UPI000CEA1E59|nr:hypothetical protein C5E44_30560 [Nocardia nova]